MLSLFTVVRSLVGHARVHDDLTRTWRAAANSAASNADTRIEAEIQQLAVVHQLAKDLETGEWTKERVETRLRESLSVQKLLYLEYFYFVTYVATLAVGVNSILIASPVAFRFITYCDNLLARLLFWPAVSLTLLVVTILSFQ